jgi:hypothetical protein
MTGLARDGGRLAPVAFGSGIAAVALGVSAAAVWVATSVVSNDSSEVQARSQYVLFAR